MWHTVITLASIIQSRRHFLPQNIDGKNAFSHTTGFNSQPPPTHTYTQAYTYIHTYTVKHTYMYTHTPPHTHTHIHTNTHTNTRTQTLSLNRSNVSNKTVAPLFLCVKTLRRWDVWRIWRSKTLRSRLMDVLLGFIGFHRISGAVLRIVSAQRGNPLSVRDVKGLRDYRLIFLKRSRFSLYSLTGHGTMHSEQVIFTRCGLVSYSKPKAQNRRPKVEAMEKKIKIEAK